MIPTLEKVARELMAPGKGILAADESESTMAKRLLSLGLANTPLNARRTRELFFTAPEIEQYLTGVILFESSLTDGTAEGTTFPRLLESRNIIPGIKVDTGHGPLANFPGEEISYGLDSLATRLDAYYEQGARFTKWRSVIHITDELPTTLAQKANAHVLARYAAVVQEHHMVPIVEPEVLFDGTHMLARSRQVLMETLDILFETLRAYRVNLRGLILKTSMALPGKQSGTPFKAPDIARETVAALTRAVPKETAGVVFLSGGQTPVQATENLNAIALHENLPWPVTFSYSRALEEEALLAWGGRDERVRDGQHIFLRRLKLAALAREGRYNGETQ